MTGEHPPGPREVWLVVERLHAVTYFAPESRQAARDLGLAGFWMGYFAFRAAPLGPAGPGLVEASFAGFARPMVARALPDAWARTSPALALAARAGAAAAALRRLAPGVEVDAADLAGPLARLVAAGEPSGRPLFAANRDVALPDDPVAALWQQLTCLREHRGDGHVAALRSAGLTGLDAHVLQAGATGTPPDLLRETRGWTADDWAGAAAGLVERGLVDRDGRLTAAGRAVKDGLEATTDRLAGEVHRALAPTELADLLGRLTPAARAVEAGGEVPFPNPMGLPRLDQA